MNDLNVLLPWLAVALSAASLAYTIYTGRSKKFDERFEKLERSHEEYARSTDIRIGAIVGEASALKDRVIVIENDFTHLPDKEVTHRLERAILEMRGEVGKLSEQVKPIAHMASRMQDAMLEKMVG